MSGRRETFILLGISLILVGIGVSLLWFVWLSYSDIVVEHQKIVAFKEKWNRWISGEAVEDWPKGTYLSKDTYFTYCVTTLFGLWDFYADLQTGQGSCPRWSFTDETTFIYVGLPLGVFFMALGIVLNPHVPIWKAGGNNAKGDEVSEDCYGD